MYRIYMCSKLNLIGKFALMMNSAVNKDCPIELLKVYLVAISDFFPKIPFPIQSKVESNSGPF